MIDPDTPAGGAAPARGRRVAFALAGLLAASVGLAVWLRPDPPARLAVPDDDYDEDDPDPLQAVVNPGYVGIDACAGCHAQRVAGFRKTRHFLACTPPAGAAAPGFAPGRNVHPGREPGLRFEMKRAGDDLTLTGVRAGPRGEERRAYTVGMVYGAAWHSDEMYFAWEGDRLFVHPVAWLYPDDRWGHAAEMVFARDAQSRCVECHNTWVAHAPGTSNRYRRDDLLMGVTCERCHGPGKEHVAHHTEYPKAAAHAILHPGKLSRERAIEVCIQCHSATFARRGPAFSYRPGEPLDASFRTAHPPHPEDDLVGNQIQYLRQSKCFQKTDMTCVTCHDPHRPHDHAAASRGCAECHAPAACKDQPRLPAEVRGDCAGCHMPPRVWMGARFHTTDDQYVPVTLRSDHRIAVHPEARQAVLLAHFRAKADAASKAEADRLAAQLAAHWVAEAEKQGREGRLMGVMRSLREAVKADPTPANRDKLRAAVARQAEFDRLDVATRATDQLPPAETIALLNKMLEMNPNYAKAHGKLGAVYERQGNRAEAENRFRAVARFDPDDAFGVRRLARLADTDGKTDAAVALWKEADGIEPYDAPTHYQWGLTLLKAERWADAAARFRATLGMDPQHSGAGQGLSLALGHSGQGPEAVKQARRVVRWTDGQDAEALLTLADAYTAADRPADARRALEQALATAQVAAPDLAPVIRARLQRQR